MEATTIFLCLFMLALILIIDIIRSIDKINHKLDNKTNTDNNIKAVDTYNNPIFREGIDYAFNVIRISLFKMWKDQDILDFENIDETIKHNIHELTNNPDKLKKINEQYQEYIKSKPDKEAL